MVEINSRGKSRVGYLIEAKNPPLSSIQRDINSEPDVMWEILEE